MPSLPALMKLKVASHILSYFVRAPVFRDLEVTNNKGGKVDLLVKQLRKGIWPRFRVSWSSRTLWRPRPFKPLSKNEESSSRLPALTPTTTPTAASPDSLLLPSPGQVSSVALRAGLQVVNRSRPSTLMAKRPPDGIHTGPSSPPSTSSSLPLDSLCLYDSLCAGLFSWQRHLIVEDPAVSTRPLDTGPPSSTPRKPVEHFKSSMTKGHIASYQHVLASIRSCFIKGSSSGEHNLSSGTTLHLLLRRSKKPMEHKMDSSILRSPVRHL